MFVFKRELNTTEYYPQPSERCTAKQLIFQGELNVICIQQQLVAWLMSVT